MTRDTGPSRATRALVLARDKGCVRCGDEAGPFDLQHRRARGAGGSSATDTNEPQNLVTLCGAFSVVYCHADVEAHPAWALADGYRVRQGQDPSTVPVRWHGEWVLLEADGTVTGTRRSA